MKEKSVFSALAELMRRNKFIRIGIYALAAILALAIFLAPRGAASCGQGENSAPGFAKEQEISALPLDAERLEARLEKILSEIRGAGKVKVMITYENTSELIVASEDESADGETGSNLRSRPATVSKNGGEDPIVLTELQPKIRGVIVIAEGASNFSVKMNIASAVCTVLGTEQEKVRVFEMNTKR